MTKQFCDFDVQAPKNSDDLRQGRDSKVEVPKFSMLSGVPVGWKPKSDPPRKRSIRALLACILKMIYGKDER